MKMTEVTYPMPPRAVEIAWDALIELARGSDPEIRLDAAERIIRLAGEIKPSVAQYMLQMAKAGN